MALAVVRVLAERAGLSQRVEFDSAGTHAHHVGEPPDPRARTGAKNRNYDMAVQRARCLSDQDFIRFDRILAMDRRNLQFLKRSCPAEQMGKLGLFLAFSEVLGVDEVPDPYYVGVDGFERVLDLCEQAAQGLVGTLAVMDIEHTANRS